MKQSERIARDHAKGLKSFCKQQKRCFDCFMWDNCNCESGHAFIPAHWEFKEEE